VPLVQVERIDMRALILWGLAALVIGTASLEAEQKRFTDAPKGNINAATNRYIIEVENVRYAALGFLLHSKLQTDISFQKSIPYMARLFAAPSSRNSTYYRQFDCGDVFQGLAVETEIDNVDTLSKFRGVTNIWPMKTVPLSSAVQRAKAAFEPRYHNYSMHQWTGVDQLHVQGIRGKGATIAIIDTGVDYTHEAVGRLSLR
jgi:subtilisin family serine protease